MLHGISPLLSLAIVMTAGVLFGNIAKRVKLPSVTGQILIGMVLGPSVLEVFSRENIQQFLPFTHFALGLVAVTVGSHLNIQKLRNAYKRLLLLVLFEATITPVLVFGLSYLVGLEWPLALLISMLAVSTAPATIVALIKETRSKGVFVKTLIAAVALNNIACIFLFQIAYTVTSVYLGEVHSVWSVVFAPFIQMIKSTILGGVVGVGLVLITRRTVLTGRLTTASAIAIVLTIGLADYLHISLLLSCLILGIVVVNLAPNKENIGHGVFANFEEVILSVFFILAGMELELPYVLNGGVIAVLVVGVRIGGKWLAAHSAMKIAGAPLAMRRYLGPALAPQAGLVVGLILLLEGNQVFAPIYNMILAVGLTSVILNELIGSVFARMALVRSGDFGRERVHLIDFISEENITLDFHAASKEEAIQQLVMVLVRSNNLEIAPQKLYESILRREEIISTCLGNGLAIPHGELEEGQDIVGAMGISSEGLDIETPDGKPVHCMVLLATPPSQRDRHLAVLAAMARSIGSDPVIQRQLYNAKSPAHVCEILQSEETRDLNYRWNQNET